MPVSPVSLTVAAVVTVRLHGHDHVVVNLPIHNGSSVPLVLRFSSGELTKSALAHPATGFTFAYKPGVMRIAPGQTRTEAVTVTIPAHDGGLHIADIITRAAPAGGHGAAAQSAGVATKITFISPGKPLVFAQHAKPVPVTGQHLAGHPTGSDTPVAVSIGVLAALLVAAVLLIRRRAKKSRGQYPGGKGAGSHLHAAPLNSQRPHVAAGSGVIPGVGWLEDRAPKPEPEGGFAQPDLGYQSEGDADYDHTDVFSPEELLRKIDAYAAEQKQQGR